MQPAPRSGWPIVLIRPSGCGAEWTLDGMWKLNAANARVCLMPRPKAFVMTCPVNLNPRSAQHPPNLRLPSKTGAIPVGFSMCPKRVPLPSSSTFGSGVACHSLQQVCCLGRLIRFSQGGYSLGLHSPVSTLLVLRRWGADKKG